MKIAQCACMLNATLFGAVLVIAGKDLDRPVLFLCGFLTAIAIAGAILG